MSKTLIQWTDHSWGYQQGCSPKSPGCSRCYAEKIAKRLAKNPKVAQYNEAIAQWDGTLNFHLQGLIEPLIRQESAIWFPSMTDPFHESARDEWIAAALLVAALCPQHRFLLLTKRPERISEWLGSESGKNVWLSASYRSSAFFLRSYLDTLVPLPKAAVKAISKAKGQQCTTFPFPNVLFGASIEDQIRANERMPIMYQLKQKGWYTFISAEPLLEEINLHLDQHPVDWVIIGGESGHKARPFNLNWGRSLLKQCRDNNVKVFFKQMGANVVNSTPYIVETAAESTNWKVNFKDKKGGDPEEWDEIFRVREMPDILVMQKDAIGRSHPNS